MFIADESYYANTIQYLTTNEVDFDGHPFLAKFAIHFFVKLSWILSGTDFPLFWRLTSIIFCILSLLLFYQLSKIMFSFKIALLATIVLATDPLYFSFSRMLQMEIPALFFFLASLYSLVLYHHTQVYKRLFFSALFLGFSLAAKISPLLLLIIFQILAPLKKPYRHHLNHILPILFLIGLGYFVANIPIKIFNKNVKFINYNLDLFSYFFVGKFANETTQTSPPWSWYIIPQFSKLYKIVQLPETKQVNLVFPFQNPLTNFLTIPTLMYLVYLNFKKGLPPAIQSLLFFFLVVYAIYFFNLRDTYYHYVLMLLPVGIILQLYALGQLSRGNKILVAVTCISTIIFVMSYPMLIGHSISTTYAKIYEHYHLLNSRSKNTTFCSQC